MISAKEAKRLVVKSKKNQLAKHLDMGARQAAVEEKTFQQEFNDNIRVISSMIKEAAKDGKSYYQTSCEGEKMDKAIMDFFEAEGFSVCEGKEDQGYCIGYTYYIQFSW